MHKERMVQQGFERLKYCTIVIFSEAEPLRYAVAVNFSQKRHQGWLIVG